VLIFFTAGLLSLRLERVNRWERIASRRRPAFSSHLRSRLIGSCVSARSVHKAISDKPVSQDLAQHMAPAIHVSFSRAFRPSISGEAVMVLMFPPVFLIGVKISFDQLHLNQKGDRSYNPPCCQVATETFFSPCVMRTPGPSPAAADSGTSTVSAAAGPFARLRSLSWI
jgi:hypothetical protein